MLPRKSQSLLHRAARSYRFPLMGGAVACTTLYLCPLAQAFSGEDPLSGNPWHHEQLSKTAAKDAGFSGPAAESLAWHADYVDSYLYNPLWWAQGGVSRFRVSLMTQKELEKLHFDDLFSAPKVHDAWDRYAMGTFAGLMWAREKGDVAAAHNVVGVSLHAMQDFYSHSNWIDQKSRRGSTYFKMPLRTRKAQALYTGAYEHSESLGVKHHGKYLPSAVIWKQPGVSTIMEMACAAISPMSNSDICTQYKLSKKGVSVRPSVEGVKIPNNVLVLAPTGIALDNTWIAPIGVKERGLRDLDGRQAFDLAYELALQQSKAWLGELDEAMARAYAREQNRIYTKNSPRDPFWTRVKNQGASDATRHGQYESYSQLPYLFLTSGAYPNGDANGVYLRMQIRTSTASMSDTDADILVMADGKQQVLDWGRNVNLVLAYNDFESGDNDSYIVGPFSSLPGQITIKNNAPNTGAVLTGLGRDFVRLVGSALNKGEDLLLSIISGHADQVATNKIVWMPEDLNKVTAGGTAFSVRLNGGQEGDYTVSGIIKRTRSDAANDFYKVYLGTLKCNKESKWDRGSNSDEPFTLVILNPLPGNLQKYRTPVFDDVDSGEKRGIGYTFAEVAIPKNSGILTLAMSQMESDDEGGQRRNQALDKFAGKIEGDTRNVKSEFLRAIGEGAAADWKVGNIEIFAFDRRGSNKGQLQAGTVYNGGNFEIEGGKSRVLSLDGSAFRATGVTRAQLLNENASLLPFPSQRPPLNDSIKINEALRDRLKDSQTRTPSQTPSKAPSSQKIPSTRTIPSRTFPGKILTIPKRPKRPIVN